MIQISTRPLNPTELAIVQTIYATLEDTQRQTLQAQLTGLVVTAAWAQDSASVDILPAVDAKPIPADLNDGILPVRAIAYEGEDVAGEILLWITDGILSAIEYAYYLGDTPAHLPTPEQIRFE